MAKLPRTEIERDEVAEGLHESLEWLHRHRTMLLVAVVALFIALVGTAIVRSSGTRKDLGANRYISEALTAYINLDNEKDADKRTTEAKKVEDAVNSLQSEYPSHPLALEGLFLLGKTQYELENFEEAQKLYGEYASKASSNADKARGEIALGYALENESFLKTEQKSEAQIAKLTEALSHYDKAVALAEPKSYLHAYALLGKARLLELTARNDEAIALYDQVIKERPVETPEPLEAERTESEMMKMIREQITARDAQINLAATANLRLKRLRPSSETETTTTTVQTSTPAAN